jgi:hypothetical protein
MQDVDARRGVFEQPDMKGANLERANFVSLAAPLDEIVAIIPELNRSSQSRR